MKRENRKLNLEIGKIKAKESIWEYSKTYSDNEIKRLTEELDSCRSDYEKLEANFYHLLELLPGEGSEQANQILVLHQLPGKKVIIEKQVLLLALIVQY